MGDLTKVTVDFERSHLVFPTIIACVLAMLGIAILIRDRRRIVASGAYWAEVFGKMDKVRFFGTIALTLVYFSLMVPIGNIWPNTGMGFLLCSVPFVFLSGVLFLHHRNVRSILTIAIVGVVSPTLVWWFFTELFFLTLP